MKRSDIDSNDLFSLLNRVKDYIEQNESGWTWEMGDCKSPEELISEGRMPQIYHEVIKAIGDNAKHTQH